MMAAELPNRMTSSTKGYMVGRLVVFPKANSVNGAAMRLRLANTWCGTLLACKASQLVGDMHRV
jgi:hypothetical protein